MIFMKTAIGGIMKDPSINEEVGMDLENKTEEMKNARTDYRRRKAVAIVLAILGVTVLIGWNMKLSANLEEIKTQQDMIQGALAGVGGSVSSEMSGFAQEVQDMLKAQDSLLADYSVKEISRDLKAGTVQYKISATPKTYQQGMNVSFAVSDGHDTIEVQGKEVKHVFTAIASCAFTDNISISAFLNQGKETQIQVLEKFEGMLSETFLWADEDLQSFLIGMDPDELMAMETTHETFINLNVMDGSSILSEVKKLDYYVLVNQKIVVSKEGKPGIQTWYGEEEEVIHGYKVDVPLDFLKNLKEGDRVVVGVLITDDFGRRYCAGSSGMTVKTANKKLVIKPDDTLVYDRTFGVDFK